MIASSHAHPSPPGNLFLNRNFILLWGAYTVSALGDHLSEMAILKSQNALEGGVDLTALTARMSFVFFLPFFLLGPVAGLLADRLPRRALMVFADGVRCAIFLGFGALMAWTTPWGRWGPVAPLLLVGLFAATFSPARSALLPTIIRRGQLVRANGMMAGMGVIAAMTAYKIGGMLAGRYDASVAFHLDAATFAGSGILLLLLRPPRQHSLDLGATNLQAVAGKLRDGVRYVRTHRSVREMLAIAAVVWFCGALIRSVVPAVVRDVYGGGYEDIGNYLAFLGAGMIIGAGAITVLGNTLRSEIAITWGLLGIGASMALFTLSVFLPLSPATLGRIGAAGILGGGFFGVAAMASFNALLQRIVPDRFRGRVFGVRDLCTTAALLAATGALGVPAWTNVDRWVGYILAGVTIMTLGTGLATLEVRFCRSPHTRIFMLLEHVTEFVAKFWWRLTVGGPRVPRRGPVLITSNHTCYADPLLFCAAATYRKISFMVAAEYCRLPIVRFFLTQAECIPVKRDGQDTAPTREVIRRLRAGKAVGIFIEGRIVPPGETHEPRDGLAMLALRTGTPVIPAHISGTRYSRRLVMAFLGRHRAHVQFGRPVDLSEFKGRSKDRQAVKAATEKIYDAIKALAPGEYSDFP